MALDGIISTAGNANLSFHVAALHFQTAVEYLEFLIRRAGAHADVAVGQYCE